MRLSAVLRPLRVGSERRAVERCAVERRAVERVDRCAVPAGGCVAHVVQSNVAPSKVWNAAPGASHSVCRRTLLRPSNVETLRSEGGAAGQIPLANCPPCC